MGWWLDVIGNILQIFTSVSFFVAAFKWGRDIMSQYNIWSKALLAVFALSVVVACLSLGERLGWMPLPKWKMFLIAILKTKESFLITIRFLLCIRECYICLW